MGKYNFSAQKWAEIEQRLEALEQANNELRKENAALRIQAKEKSLDRLLSRDIGTHDVTDAEYRIYCETLEAVIDTIYYAKMKMKGDADHGNGTDLTVG